MHFIYNEMNRDQLSAREESEKTGTVYVSTKTRLSEITNTTSLNRTSQTSMDQVPISRILVETEPDWLRVRENVSKSMKGVMEKRLSSLPGGNEGDAVRAVRKEVEERLAKVSQPYAVLVVYSSRLADAGRSVSTDQSKSPHKWAQL